MKNLFGYDFLIEKFVKREISGGDFESLYLKKYLKDESPLDEELFKILDWLFAEVDGFSHDPTVFPDDYVSEDRLRESAEATLKKLRSLK
jgi:hypothetical protein